LTPRNGAFPSDVIERPKVLCHIAGQVQHDRSIGAPSGQRASSAKLSFENQIVVRRGERTNRRVLRYVRALRCQHERTARRVAFANGEDWIHAGAGRFYADIAALCDPDAETFRGDGLDRPAVYGDQRAGEAP
jgi:hypothetical protein